jgi:hypothetical protein
MPVNYVLAGDRITLRTVPDGEIYRHPLSTNCAFEIDEADELLESGWSVVVAGRLELATEEDFAYLTYGKLPEPWAGVPIHVRQAAVHPGIWAESSRPRSVTRPSQH